MSLEVNLTLLLFVSSNLLHEYTHSSYILSLLQIISRQSCSQCTVWVFFNHKVTIQTCVRDQDRGLQQTEKLHPGLSMELGIKGGLSIRLISFLGFSLFAPTAHHEEPEQDVKILESNRKSELLFLYGHSLNYKPRRVKTITCFLKDAAPPASSRLVELTLRKLL